MVATATQGSEGEEMSKAFRIGGFVAGAILIVFGGFGRDRAGDQWPLDGDRRFAGREDRGFAPI